AERRRPRLGDHINGWRVLILAPAERASQHLSVEIDGDDFDGAHLAELARRVEAALGAALDRAARFHLFDEALEGDPFRGRHLEGAHDVAPGDRGRTGGDEVEDFLARRQAPKGLPAPRRVAATPRLCSAASPLASSGRPSWHVVLFLSRRAWPRLLRLLRPCRRPAPWLCV